MARYVATAETAWDREIAFEYLAAFSNVSDWDPGIPRAKSLSDDPLAVGAKFEVISEFRGNETELVYETIEIDPPRRVLLRAEIDSMISLDEMTFDVRPGGGTVVTYDADITLKGPRRLFDLPFRLIFQHIGDKARDGLRAKLAGPAPAPAETAQATDVAATG